MKTIIINASPRKNWNTAKILQAAQKGAESAGSETEYINLYDVSCTGCRSCLACKRAGIENPCKCYWKDELSPIIERIFAADNLIIGSPIYFGETTSQFHALMERLCFPALSYNNYGSVFKGKVNVSIFLTMNAGKSFFEDSYAPKFDEEFQTFGLLNGTVNIYPVSNTLQVDNYGNYEMKAMNAEDKHKSRDEQFPKDLDMAFKVGEEMNKKI